MRVLDKILRHGSTGPRPLRVRGTLGRRERLEVGRLRIEPMADGGLLVTDGRAAVLITPFGDRHGFTCWTDGRALPGLVAETENEARRTPRRDETPVPLCRFGPGGEFTRDYTPGETTEAPSRRDDEAQSEEEDIACRGPKTAIA